MNIIIEMIKEYNSVILNRLSKHDKHKRLSRVSSKPVILLKTTIILLGFMFLINPSQAYVEESDDGSTKLSAGEQNTNMYRITSQGKVALKKLKQIDELMAKSPTAGDGSAKNVAQVAQIVDEQNDAAVRIAAEQARQTAKLLENKSALKNNDNGQTVQMIISAAQTQTKDAEVAATLLQTLLRRRP